MYQLFSKYTLNILKSFMLKQDRVIKMKLVKFMKSHVCSELNMSRVAIDREPIMCFGFTFTRNF